MTKRTDPGWIGRLASPDVEAPARSFTLRGVHRAARDSGALPFALPPALFLVIAMAFTWHESPPLIAAIASVLFVLYGVGFVYSTAIALYPQRVRLIYFAVLTGLILALIPLIGVNVMYMVMFQAMSHVLLLPWRWGLPSMLLMAITVMGLAIALEEYIPAGFAVVALIMSWGIGYGIRQQVLEEQLDAAQQRNAVLAVAAERERIGRDLHDLLGHSLTSLTISAQLARRLLETDPDAARAQLEHIELTVRQALAEVRATSSGMQSVRAASEIASARSVLAAVGTEADAPSALPPLDEERAELFGYVIREAVTNIVRHARATRAWITLESTQVRIGDDGIGIPAGAPRTGLEGLERRVAAAGGTLTVTATAVGTEVCARLPENPAPKEKIR